MPPLKKYTKDDIVASAYEIVKTSGIEKLNARSLSSVLGCSVQPIFHNFQNMEELIKEVKEKIYKKYQEYMTVDENHVHAYKQMGLSYIKFAKDYPEFFKLLFMQETNLNAFHVMKNDVMTDSVIQAGQQLTHFSYEVQKSFHLKVWIFTHGIACLVATRTVEFQIEEIEKLLESTVRAMVVGYQKIDSKEI